MSQMEIGTGAPPEETAVARREESTEVDQLLRLAMEKDVSVDALEKLLALKERVEATEARKAFFAALAAFQAECPPILKTSDGHFAKYASLPHIVNTTRPLLRRHGFSWNWDSDLDDKLLRVHCTLTHEFGHAETSTFTAPIGQISKATSAAQNAAGALTYGRRQSFVQVTGIVTADVDNDGYQPPQPIDASAAADLQALAEEVGADVPRFLAWLGVGSFGEIPEARHDEAVRALERKRA